MYTHFGNQDWATPFGVLFVIAMIAMWRLARRNAAILGVDQSHIDLLVPLAIISGMFGGAALAYLTPMDRNLAGEGLQTLLRVRLFGMVLSGTVAVFVYSRICKQSFRSLLDILALPTVLGLFVHRFGCYLAGCCWGDISVHSVALTAIADTDLGFQVQTLPWLAGEWVRTGVQFPPGSFPFEQQLVLGLIEAGAAASLAVHPVQLYEAGLLFVLLLVMRHAPLDRHPPGTNTLTVAAAYAVIRFCIEFLRADGNVAANSLTMTQVQCVVLGLVCGAFLLFIRYRAKPAGSFRAGRS